MALNYALTSIKNFKDLCFKASPEEGVKAKTQKLIWMTLIIKMDEITEKNYLEFYGRMMTSSAVYSTDDGITLDDVRAHIGLKTNTNVRTNSSFYSSLMKEEKSQQLRRQEVADVSAPVAA